jgi:hypothetical protein
MVAWLTLNWQSVAVAVLATAEVVSMFVPGASGTVAGLVKVITGLGVKDPGIGGQ